MNKEELNKILNFQIPPKIVNTMAFALLFCVSCLLFVFNTEGIAVVNDSIFPFVFWTYSSYGICAYLTLAIIFGILYCLIGNLFVSYIILEIITICWGLANKVVLSIREQFITIEEIKVLGEAAKVDIYILEYFRPILIILVLIGCINGGLLWLLTKKMKRDGTIIQNKKKSVLLRFVIIIVFVISFIMIHTKTSQLALYSVSAYRSIGNVVWFCQSLFGNAVKDVSAEEVSEIYSNFKECVLVSDNVLEKRPNVIVIMSEAFWDTNNLNGIVEVSENPMEKYLELTEGAIAGQVAVNIYGGGTNKSEFEFLTGLNTRYFESADCYGEYYSFKQESIVSYMEELGYYTMAFHPHERDFWERELGYTNMGFDVYYSDIDFKNREICHGYISDKSLTQEIIERFEERKSILPEQPIFTFAVSVQNHVDDLFSLDEASRKKGCTGITVKVVEEQPNEELIETVEEYYNGLRESIEALEELTHYFEECEEDTVIVFFGDHAPTFAKKLCGADDKETEMNLYRTPYMIWTNYVNDYESYGDMNLSYLSSVLLEYLDLPKPNHYYLNKYMLENYPINTNYEQECLENIDEQRLLDMMSIVSTISKRFPKEEMALPYWEIVE